MDFVSHVLVGKLFQVKSQVDSLKNKLIVIVAAFAPDIPVLFVYLLLGHEKGRAFWIPYNSDWVGVRLAHPGWAAIWEIPHSIFFVLLIVIPLVLYFRWPKIAIASYLSHIALDLFTHTGEWGIKPFYPLNFIVNGFTDAWAWPLPYMAISWLILLVAIYLSRRSLKQKTAEQPQNSGHDHG